jgi:site-specific DNA-methyltransferase (adenine-specific)
LVSEHLDNPAIANARNFREAHALILKKEEELVTAELAKRRLALLPSTPDIEVRNGDLEEILPRLEADQFDLIVADPPYGIDASGGGFRARTVHHHNYVDDEATARRVAQSILTEGFRVTKFRSNIFLFTDIKHWEWLQRISAQIGWTPFRRPLIWGKSDSEGLAPWGAQGPRITTEFIFFATKGQKGLLASPIDYLRVNRVPRNERIHAAEKPVELIRKLLECSTLPGDRVLDPCCGSGSTLVACRELGRRAVGIEKDPSYFNTAMANVHGKAA